MDAYIEGARLAWDFNFTNRFKGKNGDILDELTDPVVLAAASAGGVAGFVISKKSTGITIGSALVAGAAAFFFKFGLE
jgi:hypothetical protein